MAEPLMRMESKSKHKQIQIIHENTLLKRKETLQVSF
jgi:hypothetical protein